MAAAPAAAAVRAGGRDRALPPRCSGGSQRAPTTSLGSSRSLQPPRSTAGGEAAAPAAAADDASWDYCAPDHVLERNKLFAGQIAGRTLLAPLTRGGNLPFRRLCCSFEPALMTFSEMAYARQLIKGDRVERARLYRAPEEQLFGFQVATKTVAEGAAAAALALEAGAGFLDVNCGCPIDEATRRGLGAALLRKPLKLAKMVAGIAAESPLPVTVKIRTGESERKINADRVVALLEQAGAAAVTVHGRTMEQRYKKAADWQLLGRLVAAHPSLPLVGNGDVLTHYEAEDRRRASGCAAVMVARGALIKPWVFQEMREGRELLLGAKDRVGVYRQLASLMKAHFGDDAWGRRKAWYFFPWHFNFFCRYRPLPADVYWEQSRAHPLIATRADLADPRVGEREEDLPALERLLRCEHEGAHGPIADAIYDSASDAEAAARLEALAASQLAGWEAELRAGERSPAAAEAAAVAG